jgi:hypothetical protein
MATNEFTKKLKAAIKTKIQELGIEVDDELPDYIMIMIANKKDKAKMKNDLMLFLNDNTDPFVDWLFDFFEKVNKKENEEARAREPEKVVAKKRHSSEERHKSKSRSPVRRSRSRSPREKRGRHEESDKPKRAPIRAPTPKRERERERTSRRKDERRRRSRSAENDDRRSSNKRRDDRKRITYSDEDDEEPHKTMKSHVVSKIERPPSPKVASQVVVKRRKPDPIDAKAGSSIFKRALTSLRDDEQPLSKQRRRESDVLQVNSLRTSRRTVTQNDDESDLSEDEEEERETQFIVKMGKGAITRKTIRASMDEAPPGDENYAVQHAIAAAEKVNRRKRRADDPVLAFLKLSGAQRNQKGTIDIGIEEAAKRKRKMLVAAATHGTIPPSSLAKHWNGKIEFDDDDDEEDESDDEAEIDAFLASAHDSRIPPTEALSRPLQYTVPQKKQFGTSKPPEVGKIAERCKFWPKCRNEETCSYSHPSKPCINFPNCWFGDKCMFIHPQCKFEPNCSKPTCPYTHTLPRPVAPRATAVPPRQPHPTTTPATGSDSSGTASAPTNANSSESPKKPIGTETNDGTSEQTTEEQNITTNGTSEDTKVEQNGKIAAENETSESVTAEEKSDTAAADTNGAPDILVSKPPTASKPSIQTTTTVSTAPTSSVMCRFAGRCHNEGCSFRHPKRCRYDEACTNESCYFWHPKKNAGRFRWVKT